MRASIRDTEIFLTSMAPASSRMDRACASVPQPSSSMAGQVPIIQVGRRRPIACSARRCSSWFSTIAAKAARRAVARKGTRSMRMSRTWKHYGSISASVRLSASEAVTAAELRWRMLLVIPIPFRISF